MLHSRPTRTPPTQEQLYYKENMKLKKIIDARCVLSGFTDDEKISAHLSYWMTKFLIKTENEYSFYVNEMQKLLNTFAVKNNNGELVIPSEKIANFNEAIEKLGETDVEDPQIRFSLSELSAELKLSMKQMYSLFDFVDEEN